MVDNKFLHKYGDIWDAPEDYIVVPVNCHGVMGRGIAKQAMQKFPIACRRDVGHRRSFAYGSKLLRVSDRLIFFPVKNNYWNKADLRIISESAADLGCRLAVELNCASIAMPLVGCGHGELTWDEVEPILNNSLADFEVVVYHPIEGLREKYPASFKPAARKDRSF